MSNSEYICNKLINCDNQQKKTYNNNNNKKKVFVIFSPHALLLRVYATVYLFLAFFFYQTSFTLLSKDKNSNIKTTFFKLKKLWSRQLLSLSIPWKWSVMYETIQAGACHAMICKMGFYGSLTIHIIIPRRFKTFRGTQTGSTLA